MGGINLAYIEIKSIDRYYSILSKLENVTKYVELLKLVDDTEPNFLINKYNDILIVKKEITDWHNTGAKGTMFKFDMKLKNRKEFFSDLKKFDSFFYNIFDAQNGETVEITNFGYMNIAFFSMQGKFLFYTNTHEGLAWITNELSSI